MVNPIDQPLPPPVNRTKSGKTGESAKTQTAEGRLPEHIPDTGPDGQLSVSDVRNPAGQSAVRDYDPKMSRPAGPDVSYQRESPEPRTVDEARIRELGPAPVGSKDYVAGQPVDEEEFRRTEAQAKARFIETGPDRTPGAGLVQGEPDGEI